MNKIYSDQMAKAEALSAGIRKNESVLSGHSIHINTSMLDQTCRELAETAARQEEAETALKEVRDKAHELLAKLKELCNEAKAPVKMNFPPEQWAKFGLADKR